MNTTIFLIGILFACFSGFMYQAFYERNRALHANYGRVYARTVRLKQVKGG